jgi:murein DD-endopeptidase MepM/ murein hydrolase activator NlpD
VGLVFTAFIFNQNLKTAGVEDFNTYQAEILDKSQYLSTEANLACSCFNLNLTQGSSLEAIAPPFNISGEALGSWGVGQSSEIIEYTVKTGDTLSSIAEDFDISLQTILWANNLTEKSTVSIGKIIIILPTTGILHTVRQQDTLSEIAEIYKVDIDTILDFNDVIDQGKIYTGDTLIIPNGKMPKAIDVKYKKVTLNQSFFICPIPSPCRITQGLHWQNAIDFSNGICGEPIFAAAAGVIQKTGYTSRGGNYVKILHLKGVITYYGHLSKDIVYPGQKVFQGQIIGYMGHTGHTIPAGYKGCHVHFQVIFAENPFAKYGTGTCLGN